MVAKLTETDFRRRAFQLTIPLPLGKTLTASGVEASCLRTATEFRRSGIYPPEGGLWKKTAGLIGKGRNLRPLSTIALSVPGMAGGCFQATEVLNVANWQRNHVWGEATLVKLKTGCLERCVASMFA